MINNAAFITLMYNTAVFNWTPQPDM